MFLFKNNSIYEILDCLREEKSGFLVLSQRNSTFNTHLRSMEIKEFLNNIEIVSINTQFDGPPVHSYILNNKMYTRNKQFY